MTPKIRKEVITDSIYMIAIGTFIAFKGADYMNGLIF